MTGDTMSAIPASTAPASAKPAGTSIDRITPPPSGGARLGALALAAAGVLFLAYPAVRPWHDESTVSGATASMSSSAWVAAHFFAMVGFILVPLGLLALRSAAASNRLVANRPLATAT